MDEPRSWGVAGDPGKAARQFGKRREQVKEIEHALELEVSRHIRAMPFLWMAVDDPPGPVNQRGLVERNAIALLSNYRKPALDNPSANWLGRHSDRERVRDSGLWNNNHVDEDYDPEFLETLAALVESTPPP